MKGAYMLKFTYDQKDKIGIIKALRVYYGLGLKEAKHYIDDQIWKGTIREFDEFSNTPFTWRQNERWTPQKGGFKLQEESIIKLWLLQSSNTLYGFKSAVVIAETESKAVKIHPDNANKDQEWWYDSDAVDQWDQPRNIIAVCLGHASRGLLSGEVVCYQEINCIEDAL